VTAVENAQPLAKARLSPWAPLRNGIFRALFIAQLASNIGTLMQSVGSAWLMGDLQASPVLVALVQTATFLPVFVLGIPSGALADVVDRRKLLVVTQTWMMCVALTLAALAFADRVTPALLLGLTFALGIGSALNSPAWQAIQPELVPREHFSQAIALSGLAFNVGRSVGPAIAGLVLAGAGAEWVFMLNALSFIGIVAVLVRWRPTSRKDHLPAETLAGATRAGLRYGIHAPVLRAVLMRVAVFVLPGSAIQALLPVVVRDSLGLGSAAYGVLVGCFGIGAAASAIARPRVEARLSPDRLLSACSLLIAATLLVEGFATAAWIAGIALLVAGFAWTTALTTTNIAAQSTLPAWVRARGMGLYMLVLTGCVAAGAAIFGIIASRDVRAAHVVAAIALLAGVVLTANRRLDATVGVDLTPVPGTDPIVTFMPGPAEGPILVTVTYRVPPSKMEQFVDAMAVVERHRRRTGAHRWGLFRDLADPERFLETFAVDSWAEHLRQHQRATPSSEEHLDEVRRFIEPDVAVAHYLSAFSDGALEQVDPAGDARGDRRGGASGGGLLQDVDSARGAQADDVR
jgi:MFS family permease/quinol monooxygenase YgiN